MTETSQPEQGLGLERGRTGRGWVEDPSRQGVVIEVGGAHFAIRITQVHEVLHVPRITRLPFPPPSVSGVVNVRGAILPVLDMGDRLFGVPSRRDGRLVVVDEPQSGGEIALLVDQVIDLIGLDAERHDVPPEAAASLPDAWIDSVLSPGAGRLITLLNLPPVLAREHAADEEAR